MRWPPATLVSSSPRRRGPSLFFLYSALPLALGCAAILPPPGLGGTSWQIVAFRGGDGSVLRPDDSSRYTIAFEPDGIFTARIDCNRARGGWKSSAPGRIELGAAIAATRAQCPPGSLHDLVMRQLPYVRSYTVKDGRLHLSLMADGGTFELTSLPLP